MACLTRMRYPIFMILTPTEAELSDLKQAIAFAMTADRNAFMESLLFTICHYLEIFFTTELSSIALT